MFVEKSVDPSTNGIQNPAYLTVEKPVNKFLEVTKVSLHMYAYTCTPTHKGGITTLELNIWF